MAIISWQWHVNVMHDGMMSASAAAIAISMASIMLSLSDPAPGEAGIEARSPPGPDMAQHPAAESKPCPRVGFPLTTRRLDGGRATMAANSPIKYC